MSLLCVATVIGGTLAFLSLSMLSYPKGLDFVLKDWPFGDWASQIFNPPGSGPRVFRGIVVLLIASFLVGLPAAVSASVPLPKVRITKQPDVIIEGVADPLEGWMVAHSDGYWHLFPRCPTDENEELPGDLIHRDLISIPDDKAVVVRTFGVEVAPAKDPSEADGQRDAEEARPESKRGGEVDVSPPDH